MMEAKWPLVGILSGFHHQKLFTGDDNFFRAIASELSNQNGSAFVFTPDGIKEETIEGFSLHDGMWEKDVFPYPDLVYNRLPSRKSENTKKMRKFFNKLCARSIPCFNTHFLHKWEIYHLLLNNKAIRYHLPETILLTDTSHALGFLQKHSFLYAKPVSGRTGSGIFTLNQTGLNEYKITFHEKERIVTDVQLSSLFSHLLLKGYVYILQQGILLNELGEQKYDFRIILQKPSDEWELTGIGVRAAQKGGITTHVPKGGSILTLSEINPPVDFEMIMMLGKEAVKSIETSHTEFRECSIDMGRDIQGNYWIFELNTKPMVFDEVGIEEKRIKTLVEIFKNRSIKKN